MYAIKVAKFLCRWEAVAWKKLPFYQKCKLILITINFNNHIQQWVWLHNSGRWHSRVSFGCNPLSEVQCSYAWKRRCSLHQPQCFISWEFPHYLGRCLTNFSFSILRFIWWSLQFKGQGLRRWQFYQCWFLHQSRSKVSFSSILCKHIFNF